MLLADLVLLLHAAFILGVVVPVPLIALGKIHGWRWVRSLPLRLLHLGMIAVVVAESLLGIDCPLTVWENSLRTGAGESAYAKGFIADWTHRLVFWELPTWVFAAVYAGFGGIILLLWWWVPPSKKRP